MTLVGIVVVLVVIGVIMWLINSYIPMAGGIKSLLNIVVFVVVVVWLLQVFGLIGNIPGVRIPPLR
ncbi:MAG: Thivi_2564 family membrane protein [Candidatus Binataceae bacterium]